MGKLSQEWLHLQSYATDNHGNKHFNYIWGASLVEASLKPRMELWEQRNKDAHSPEAHIHLAKERAAKATRKLYKLCHHVQFRDSALFSDNTETFIEESTPQKLQRYVLMNSKAIQQSVRRAGTAATQHTRSILNWLHPGRTQNDATSQKHHRDNLVHDAYSKKKRHKTGSAQIDRTHQPKLTGYLSLNT